MRVLRAGADRRLASRAESGPGRSVDSFVIFWPRERGVRAGDREGYHASLSLKFLQWGSFRLSSRRRRRTRAGRRIRPEKGSIHSLSWTSRHTSSSRARRTTEPQPNSGSRRCPSSRIPPPRHARHRRKPRQPARRGQRNGALTRGAPTERGLPVGEPAQPKFFVFLFENSLPSITAPDPDPAAPHAPQAKVHAHCGEHGRRARCSVGRPRRRAGDDKPTSTGRTRCLS